MQIKEMLKIVYISDVALEKIKSLSDRFSLCLKKKTILNSYIYYAQDCKN